MVTLGTTQDITAAHDNIPLALSLVLFLPRASFPGHLFTWGWEAISLTTRLLLVFAHMLLAPGVP